MQLKKFIFIQFVIFLISLISFTSFVDCFRKYSKQDVKRLREEVREMFQHAYNGYLKYASNYDELRPLSCDGVDTWGSYSLTLIDALDTLAVMGNYTEFRRVVKILEEKSNFDADINVSVFETNIRIVGGLLSAHLMSLKGGVEVESGWPCNGPLLRLAEDVARRLLPAFDTKTGMPYGTVNLRHGVPAGETPVTCTAGVGTFIVEFGALSRLTGDQIFEEVALNALYALWKHKSPIGLFGNHIDVQTGRWTAQDSGIGAGVDSYYEYLVKGAIMLNRPELLEMFLEGRKSINKYLKRDDWYIWTSMSKGKVTLPVFQSLEAYWPGVLSLIGETTSAMRTLHNYHTVWKQYGFLPEFYNIPTAEAGVNRENYPLRPELIESAMYLYRSTSDPYLLEIGEDMLKSIQYSAKTPCGYATIKNVRDHRKEDRMESFFLAETTKYLYLLFDADNFLHNNGGEGTVYETPNGMCILDAGGYIFNTEAHPIDPSALRCCHVMPRLDLFNDFKVEKFLGDVFVKKEPSRFEKGCSEDMPSSPVENVTIEIEQTIDINESRKKIIDEIMVNLKNQTTIERKSLETSSKIESNLNDELIERTNSPIIDKVKKIIKELQYSKKIFKEMKSHITRLVEVLQMVIQSIEKSHLELFYQIEYLNITEDHDKIQVEDNFEQNSAILQHKNSLMEVYRAIGKNHLTLNVIRGLQNLNELSFNTTDGLLPRRIIHSVSTILQSLREGTEKEPDLYENNKDIMKLLLNAQDKYTKFVHEKEYYADIFSILQYYNVKELDEIVKNRIILTKIIDAKNNRNSNSAVDETTHETLTYKLFDTLEDYIQANSKFNTLTNEVSFLKTLVTKITEIKYNDTKSDLNENKQINDSENVKENRDKVIQSDDIILVMNKKANEMKANEREVGQGTVELVSIDAVTSALDNTEETSKDETNSQQPVEKSTEPPEVPQLKSFMDDSNNSIISHFVQTILKSALPTKKLFEPQQLLAKIRENGIYLNKTQNFELFTCKAQSYLQRISVHGEFF